MLAKGLNDIGEAQPGYSFGDIIDNTDKWPLIQVRTPLFIDVVAAVVVARVVLMVAAVMR
jgi:hypothetical protein